MLLKSISPLQLFNLSCFYTTRELHHRSPNTVGIETDIFRLVSEELLFSIGESCSNRERLFVCVKFLVDNFANIILYSEAYVC